MPKPLIRRRRKLSTLQSAHPPSRPTHQPSLLALPPPPAHYGKMAHHKPICAELGWLVAVFAADVYGAMHPYAQQLMAKLALRVASRGYLGDFKRDYSAVWAAISAAIVSRAASQHLRHALPDDDESEFYDEVLGATPAGLPDPAAAPIVAADVATGEAEAPMEESLEELVDVVDEDEPAPQEPAPLAPQRKRGPQWTQTLVTSRPSHLACACPLALCSPCG